MPYVNISGKSHGKKKHLDTYFENFEESQNETVLNIEYNNLLELANKAIDKLPEKRKIIFMLSRHKGLSNAEIANRLQISIKTVENQMTQALKFLREHLGQDTLLPILFYSLFII